jgi:hypothetical protein
MKSERKSLMENSKIRFILGMVSPSSLTKLIKSREKYFFLNFPYLLRLKSASEKENRLSVSLMNAKLNGLVISSEKE